MTTTVYMSTAAGFTALKTFDTSHEAYCWFKEWVSYRGAEILNFERSGCYFDAAVLCGKQLDIVYTQATERG